VSVVANVAINVDSSGAVSKLRQVQQGAQATQRATTDLTTAFSKLQAGATNAFSKLQAGAAGAFSKLQAGAAGAVRSLSGLRGVLASIGATAAVSKAFGDAQALMLAQKRLSRLTQEYKQFAGAQQEAERLANKFEVSVTDTAGALGSLASRLGAQGRSLNDIVAVYEGLNSALVATGRSSTEAAAASYQLSQALGSGSLTGDELKTISETLPELLNEVAKAAGVSSLQIRELAKDGKLSADLIIQATKQLRDKYSQDVEANITATQKFQNALSGLSEAVGTELAPAITELLKAGAEALKLFGKLPGPVKTLIAAIAGLTAAFVALAPAISTVIGLLTAAQLAALVAAGPWIALAAGITAAAVALASYRTESEKIGAKAAAGDPAAMSAARGRMVTLEQEIALMKLEGAEKASPRSALGGSFANAKAEFARLKRDVTTGQTAAATPTPTPTPTPTTGTGTGKGAGKGKDDAARIAEQIRVSKLYC
jgi:tape measure domain-containing protein